MASWAAVPPANAQASDAENATESAPARAILRNATDLIKYAKTISVEAERSIGAGPQLQKSTFRVKLKRPNQIAIRVEGGQMAGVVVSDGKSLSMAALQKYSESPAPATLEGLLTEPVVMGISQSIMFATFCSDDPHTIIMEGVSSDGRLSVENLGVQTLNGEKTHRILLKGREMDLELWVNVAGKPLIRRSVADLSKMLARTAVADQVKGQKIELVETYTNWHVDEPLDDGAFAFVPPKGSTKVKSLFEGPNESDQVSPLVGMPAPDITLKELDNGEFRLKSHQGKDVVMLDFWATWFPPCLKELSILAEVAREYEKKGVVFRAINQREQPDEISAFLKKNTLAIKVALDTRGSVGEAYEAQLLPALVLIDKKGIVRSVHAGDNPELKRVVSKELDALLAGRDLATEQAANETANEARKK
jgi:peroxiredoxin